ncbi:hypothetical protein D3C77_599020 [compost metagenome]
MLAIGRKAARGALTFLSMTKLFMMRNSRSYWSWIMIIVRPMLHMSFQCFSDGICNRFYTIWTEADGAGTANALQMLDQQLNLLSMIPITQEQGAYAAKCFCHGEDV